jgi:ABC-type transport system involved in cytochrome c biogenesis ATPase subunit
MGAETARQYNRNMAKNLSAGIQRILDRINQKYTPLWMLAELEEARHKAQCIQQEFESIMRGYGDEI